MACRKCGHRSTVHTMGRCFHDAQGGRPIKCQCSGWSPAPLEVVA